LSARAQIANDAAMRLTSLLCPVLLTLVTVLGASALAGEKAVSDDQIRTTVDGHVADLKACMGQHGSATGQVRVEFTIQPDGKVSDAKVGQASSNAKLDQCIAGSFRKWTFPKPKGGGVWVSSYPITFSAPPPPKKGTLTEEEIVGTIKPKLPEVQACMAEAKKESKAEVSGIVDVGIAVAASGTVADVKVLSTTTKLPKLDECIVTRVKAWTFPKPKGGGEAAFHYPFKLNVP
jgi:TonB family protein